MSNAISRIIPGLMISASALTGCEHTQPKTTLTSLMANRPVKEHIAIRNSWREGLAKDADMQHSLDSVAYCRFFQELPITKSSAKVKEFNQIAARTRLTETSDYNKAFKDFDNKMIEEGVTLNDFNTAKNDYKLLTIPSFSFPQAKELPNEKAILKLRQFKLDSLAYGKFIEQYTPSNGWVYYFKQLSKTLRP